MTSKEKPTPASSWSKRQWTAIRQAFFAGFNAGRCDIRGNQQFRRRGHSTPWNMGYTYSRIVRIPTGEKAWKRYKRELLAHM